MKNPCYPITHRLVELAKPNKGRQNGALILSIAALHTATSFHPVLLFSIYFHFDKKKLATDQKNLNAARLDRQKAEHMQVKALNPRINGVAPSSAPTKITAEQEQAVNAANGTNVNIRKVLNETEGGSHADGYVPWWPDARADANGNQVVAVNESGELQGYLGIGGCGGPNNSGVTVGPGVDLGAQKKNDYFKSLNATNAKTQTLSTDELQALKDKISPYMGLKAAKACQYLRAHPVHLDPKELGLLTRDAIDTHLKDAMRTYKSLNFKGDFSQLTRNQQTILFSEAYQHGTGGKIFKTTATQYGHGNSRYDPPGRENGWINQ